MAKNFMKSIGSKNLSSLIPTEAPEEEKMETKGKVAKKKISTPKAEKKTNKTTVTTFRINNDNLVAVKALAFWERKKIQDVLNEALEAYLQNVPSATLKKAKSEFSKRSK